MVIYSLIYMFCVSPSPLKIGQHPLYCALNVDTVALIGRQCWEDARATIALSADIGQPREDTLVTQGRSERIDSLG